MSLETEGFLSRDAELLAQGQANHPSGWGMLLRELNRTVQRLLVETRLSSPTLLSEPPVLARMLLGRALSNFQGAVLMLERGMAVEARTLARSCLETAFCLTAALAQGESFGTKLLADAEKHRRMLAKNLLAVTGDDLESEMAAQLRALVDSVPPEVVPQWLPAQQMAQASPLADMFVFYRLLSGEAAHPTIGSLERYILTNDDEIQFAWGPELEPQQFADTAYLLCTFIIASAVAFNGEVARDEVLGGRLAELWREMHDLLARTSPGTDR